jgi:hypothetical protein
LQSRAGTSARSVPQSISALRHAAVA